MIAGLAATVLPARSGPTPERDDRRIRVMERIIDEALVDSPNWLVHGDHPTRGVYLSDFGAVFEVDLSTTSENGSNSIYVGPGKTVIIDEKGNRLLRSKSGWQRFFSGDDEKDLKKETESASKLYEKGKDELAQLFLDNAEVLSVLPAGQSVVLAVTLDDSDLRTEKNITRLLLRVSSDDLKAYAEGRISESDFRGRIRFEES